VGYEDVDRRPQNKTEIMFTLKSWHSMTMVEMISLQDLCREMKNGFTILNQNESGNQWNAPCELSQE
jgi:hypothetical protein